MKVPLYRHNLHGADIEALGEEFKKVLRGMILSTGSVCEEMQQKINGIMDTRNCFLTNNWTNAMTATLLACNIGPGDEVIIPSLTFSATANAVEAAGATPVFVDVRPDTKLMDLYDVGYKLTPQTKAIIPVHLYGQMVDVQKLRSFVANTYIFEDAAHAIEAEYYGKKPGAFSDAAMFSFYSSKNITTGEGGAMITNDNYIASLFKTVYRHGIDIDGYYRHYASKFVAPEAVTRGVKGNMPDLLALLLGPQLDNLEQSHAKRVAHAQRYIDELADLPIELPKVDPKAKHAWHVFAVGVDPVERMNIIQELDARGIRTAIQFKPLHAMTYFASKYKLKAADFPNSEDWGNKTFSLPVFPDMTEDEQSYVIENLRDVLTK